MVRQNKQYALRVSLDLASAVDAEVYNILKGYKSGTEIKNYLVNAILYYARSPLVHSTGLMEKLISLLENGYTGLQESSNGAKVQESFDLSSSDPVMWNELSDLIIPNRDKNKLGSLKDKFKI